MLKSSSGFKYSASQFGVGAAALYRDYRNYMGSPTRRSYLIPGDENRAPGKDAPLEEQLECAAEQEGPNAGLLEYLRAGQAWPEGVGERRALMKLVREEFEN